MTSATDCLNVGILGAGRISNGSHIPILRQMSGVRIAWLCDQAPDRAAASARNWKIPQSFGSLADCPPVDAVLVAIPVGYRREAMAHIFERRWHALVEKPFAITASDHLGLVQSAQRANVEVGIGLMRRFFRSTNIARAALEARLFGEVREVWVAEAKRTGATGRDDSYQSDPVAGGGGMLIEWGAHLVDQVFHVLNVESFDNLKASFTKADGIDVEARTAAHLTCAGARHAVPMRLLVSRIRDAQSGVVICCEHGTLRFGLGSDATVEVLDRRDRAICRLDRPVGVTNLYQAFYSEWQAFLEQCRSRKPSLVDASSAVLSTRFIEEAYLQARGGNS
jgi:predicted dehydrogenase